MSTDSLQLIVVHFGRGLDHAHVRDLIQIGRKFQIEAAQRHGLQILDGVQLIFRILHGYEIVVAAVRVDPVAGGDHGVRSQRGDQVVDDFLRIQAQFAGPGAIHIHLQRGIIHILRNVDVRNSGNRAELPRQILRDAIVALQVRAAHLNIDRRGRALVEHRIHQAAGLKISPQLRNLRGDARAHPVHVDEAADLVVFLQSHLNKRGVHSGVRREQGGKIGRQANIGNDGFQFLRRDNLVHDVFHALHVIVGQLNPRARRRLHVDDELSGVGARKKGNAHEGIQQKAKRRKIPGIRTTTSTGRSSALRTHFS